MKSKGHRYHLTGAPGCNRQVTRRSRISENIPDMLDKHIELTDKQ
ncbi:hypothetical protein [Serratia proteamaculans]|nr:hypothetical protein [Serratia proteamaculans]